MLVSLLKNNVRFGEVIAKNAFCQGILPDDKITIMGLPPGDPEAEPNKYWLLQRTLYGLHCCPHHWNDKISKILQTLGLRPSLKDPCLFTGFVRDPNNPAGEPTTKPLSLSLYDDNFVYFSEDTAVEDLCCCLST